MKRKLAALVMGAVMVAMSANAIPAQANKMSADNQQQQQPKVELTEKQQGELAALYQEINKLKKQVLDKYVEFGSMTKEQADKVKSWIDQHYKRMEENGFKPMERHHFHRDHDKDDKDDNGDDD
ncbi:hypothetical protein GCM10008967_10370 [Bacillus carboniphilus]|uniref:DUF2680 domain-containing protein n=1 Tax=Bacillus carboniphilus TaxID=86663 RepID=A0ABN0W0F9_9BACI